MSYYKVVRVVGDKKYSALAYGEAMVVYLVDLEIGKWITPPLWLWENGYWLCLFDDLDVAKGFALESAIIGEIWECEVGGSVKGGENLPPYLSLFDLAAKSMSNSHGSWYSGTVMAERIRLKELSLRIRRV